MPDFVIICNLSQTHQRLVGNALGMHSLTCGEGEGSRALPGNLKKFVTIL